MHDHQDQLQYSLVEVFVLVTMLLVSDVVLGDELPHESEETGQQLIVEIPELIVIEKGWHEVSVTDEFGPGKGKARMDEGTYFLEFLGQNAIEDRDLLILNVVLLAVDVTDQVGE